jgi:hypothetical protein
MNPIEPKRISKSTNSLTKSSLVKAGLVFLGTVGTYYLAKTTGIFSYFGWGVKNSNLKDFGNNEIVSAKKSLSARTNLETTKQINNPSINRIAQTYRGEDRTVEFEEIKVEKFKAFSNLKKENVEDRRSSRRSINVQNPIPNQNAIVGKPFELTIDGNNVFDSNSTLSLEATNIPTWLTSSLNPNPTFKGSYDAPMAYGVTISENYAYVADHASDLLIIDISDPSNPTTQGAYDTPGTAFQVALSGDYAYVAAGNPGLQIINVSDSSKPTFKGSYNTPGYALGVALSGNYAYVGAGGLGLQIVDIIDPSNPIFKGSYDTTPGGAFEVALSGNYAYVTDGGWSYWSGLQIIDITDPSNPTFKGSYNTFGSAMGLALSGNYAYVATMDSGLQIVDIGDPSNPTFKSSYNTPGSALGVTLSGNYAYVVGGNYNYSLGFLQVVDISDQTNPIFKGSYNTPGGAFEAAISGNYAYVVGLQLGLEIIAFNPNKLTLSGTPSAVGTYSVDIKACNEIMECAADSFEIIVRDIDDTTDTLDNVDTTDTIDSVTGTTDLTNSIIIITSMTVAVCVACIASFSLPLIIGAVIVMSKRNRNKILGNEDNIKEKELKKIKELKE